MTGKQLTDDQRAILAKLLQLPKLSNHEIAWVLGVDVRTIRRRRCEFAATGELKKHKDVSKNAEKLTPQHLEKLLEWHKEHPDALLDDMQMFLQTQCGLEVSSSTISRQIRKAYGKTSLRQGHRARIRARKLREEEGRSIALELQKQPSENSSDQWDQRQLAPLEQALGQHQEPDCPWGSGQDNPASSAG